MPTTRITADKVAEVLDLLCEAEASAAGRAKRNHANGHGAWGAFADGEAAALRRTINLIESMLT